MSHLMTNQLQNKLNEIYKLSTCLSQTFGRLTKNPLLYGQDISEVIRGSLKHITKSMEFFDMRSTKKERFLFRTSIIYTMDKVTDALESDGNSEADIEIATMIRKKLNELLVLLDSTSNRRGRRIEDGKIPGRVKRSSERSSIN